MKIKPRIIVFVIIGIALFAISYKMFIEPAGFDNYQSIPVKESIEIDSISTDELYLNAEKIFVRKGEFWKLWKQAHEDCMSSSISPNAIYFGMNNAYIGTLYDKSLRTKYNDIDVLGLTEKELDNVIDGEDKSGIPCNLTTTKANLDSMAITSSFANVLGSLDETTKSSMSITNWSVIDMNLDVLVAYLEAKKESEDPLVQNYIKRFFKRRTRYVKEVVRISEFDVTIVSDQIRNLNIDVPIKTKMSGTDVSLTLSRTNNTTIKIKSEGTFYMLGNIAKIRKRDILDLN